MLPKNDQKVSIKWPNDIFLQGKKISGILAETEQEGDKTRLYLGYGLNVNTDEEVYKTLPNASSLYIATHKEFSLKELRGHIDMVFIKYLKTFFQEGFHPFHKAFQELSFLTGKKVALKDGSQELTGHCQGVNEEGCLILKLEDGTEKTISSGEIISWE